MTFARSAVRFSCLCLAVGLCLTGGARSAGAGGDAAKPVGVDLRKLPPSPAGGNGQPSEAPAPGIPDYRPHLVRDVKLDLGRRLGIDIGDIEPGEPAPATWPDAGLGCPQPGQVYSQAIVPGYRITLTAGGRAYVYHTDARTRFVLCAGEPPPARHQ